MRRTPERHPLARLVNLPRRRNGNGNGRRSLAESIILPVNRQENGVERLSLVDIEQMERDPRNEYVQPQAELTWEEKKITELRTACDQGFRGSQTIEESLLWHWRRQACEVSNFYTSDLRRQVPWIIENLQPKRDMLDIHREAGVARQLINSLRNCNDPNYVYISVGSMEFAMMSRLAYQFETRDRWGNILESIVEWPLSKLIHTRAVAKIAGVPRNREGCGISAGTHLYFKPSTQCAQNGMHNALLRKYASGGANYHVPFGVANLPRLKLQELVWGKDHAWKVLQHAQLLADQGDTEKTRMQEEKVTAKDEYLLWLMLGAMQNERYIVHLPSQLLRQDPALQGRGFFRNVFG